MSQLLETLNIVTALSGVILALYVLWRERGTLLSLVFFWFVIPLVVWMAGQAVIMENPDYENAVYWGRIVSVALGLIPFNLLLFSCAAVGGIARLRWLLAGVFVYSSVCVGLLGFTDVFYGPAYPYSWGYYINYNAAYFAIFFPVLSFAMAAAMVIFFNRYRTATGSRRARLKWLMLGLLIGYISVVDYLPTLGVSLRPVSSIPLLIMIGLYAYAILRYRLINLDAQYAAGNVLSAMESGVVVCDANGSVRLVNDALAEALGRPKETFTDTPVQDLLLDASRHPMDAAYLALLDASAGPFDGYYRSHNGSVIPISFTLAPLSEGGERVGYVIVAQDVSERRRMEVNLRKLESALEQTASIVFITDTKGNIEYANPSLCRISGYSREELVGENPRLFKSGLLPESFYKKLWDTITGGQRWFGEIQNKAKDGRLYWVSTSVNPIYSADGTITHFAAVQEDVTARKANEGLLAEAYENLKQAQAQLVESAKMESVGRLSAGLAHEVKNPLSIVVLGVQYLKTMLKASDKQVQDVLEDITAAVRRADRVVHNMLQYSHPRRQVLRPGRLNVVIESALGLMKYDFEKHRVHLHIKFAPTLPPVMIEPVLIEQVLINLFLNAIDAMEQGGTLLIQTMAVEPDSPEARALQIPARYFPLAQPYVVLIVRDSGTGFPEEIIPRVFDPFFTTKEPGKGTGLGLSLSQTAMKEHNGSILVRNAAEGGAEAILIFPAADEAVGS